MNTLDILMMPHKIVQWRSVFAPNLYGERLMRNVVILIVVVLIGAVGWRIGGRLSPDAMGLATGVVFGVLAGLPTALLVLAADRNRGHGDDDARGRNRQGMNHQYGGYPHQPPVIVLAGGAMAPPPQQPESPPDTQYAMRALPAPPKQERHFRVFGDAEDIVEDEFRA